MFDGGCDHGPSCSPLASRPSRSRVDHLNDGDGRLNMSELGNALGLVRPTEEE